MWGFSLNWLSRILAKTRLCKGKNSSLRWGLTEKRSQRSLTKVAQRETLSAPNMLIVFSVFGITSQPPSNLGFKETAYLIRFLYNVLFIYLFLFLFFYQTGISLWNLEQFLLNAMNLGLSWMTFLSLNLYSGINY